MIANELLKFFCVLTILGLAAAATAKLDVKKVDDSELHKPSSSKNAGKAQPFWDPDFCNGYEDMDAFPHPDSCKKYLICWDGQLWEQTCNPGNLFDPVDQVCDPAENVVCLNDPLPNPDPQPEEGCPPPGSDELVFLPSVFCDEYYICINGNPVLRFCRPGLHWNIEEELCDNPSTAGCDDSVPDPPSPDNIICRPGFVGQIPHPESCNLFIHCSNGSQSVQHCQHLHRFDVDLGRCVFKNTANCPSEFKRTKSKISKGEV